MDPDNPNPINPRDHAAKARQIVFDYVSAELEKKEHDGPIDSFFSIDDVYVVSFTFVLGNWKALVSTMRPDQKYYEVTYNMPREETYLDVYQKFWNHVIKDEDRRDGGFRDAVTGRYVGKDYAKEHTDTTVHES